MSSYPRFRYERMFPSDLRRLVAERPVAYLGVGPLEWHGEHLAFGTDPVRGHGIMEALWREEGGALLPPLFLGTDRQVEKEGEILRGMEMFAGMKLPGTVLVDESVFSGIVGGVADSLERAGFRLLVLCTGHWASNQLAAIHRLAAERSGAALRVLAWPPEGLEWPGELCPGNSDHAGIDESSEIAYYAPRSLKAERYGSGEGDRRVDLLPGDRRRITRRLGRARFEWELGRLRAAFAAAAGPAPGG